MCERFTNLLKDDDEETIFLSIRMRKTFIEKGFKKPKKLPQTFHKTLTCIRKLSSGPDKTSEKMRTEKFGWKRICKQSQKKLPNTFHRTLRSIRKSSFGTDRIALNYWKT